MCVCVSKCVMCMFVCYQNMGAEKWAKMMMRGVKVELTINAHFSLKYEEKTENLVTHHFHHFRLCVCMCVCVSARAFMCVITSLEHFGYISFIIFTSVMAMTHTATFFYLNEQSIHRKFLIRTRFSIMLITFYNSRESFSCALYQIPKTICNERFQRTHTYERMFSSKFICSKGVVLFNSIYCP